MLRHIIKRILLSLPLLIGITFISFLVIHLAPGEPISLQTDLNPRVSAASKAQLRHLYGLDEPLPVQYGKWAWRSFRLDFGQSFAPDARKVTEKIAERIPITIFLSLLEMLVIVLIAIPIGILSATRQYSLFDKATTIFVFLGFAMPTFWLALLCMNLFGVHLGWLPISGLQSMDYFQLSVGGKILDRARHLIMPVLVGAFGGLAGFSRYMRSNMLEVIRQDYIRTARAKGLSERTVIYKHALRNALLPVVTILGLSVPSLIGGGVIFETIFAIPGMGQLFYGSVMSRDYPVIMGILVIGAALTLLGNLLADISYALVDPRIRVAKER
jgi:peptide/nickel transport system permease protein